MEEQLRLGRFEGWKRLGVAVPTKGAAIVFVSTHSGVALTYGVKAEAVCIGQHGHQAPFPGHLCGFNVCDDPDNITNVLHSEWNSEEETWEAKVALTGKYVRHANGVRGQYQEVLTLRAHKMCRFCMKDATLIGVRESDRRAVPVCEKCTNKVEETYTLEECSEKFGLPVEWSPTPPQELELRVSRYEKFIPGVIGLLAGLFALPIIAAVLSDNSNRAMIATLLSTGFGLIVGLLVTMTMKRTRTSRGTFTNTLVVVLAFAPLVAGTLMMSSGAWATLPAPVERTVNTVLDAGDSPEKAVKTLRGRMWATVTPETTEYPSGGVIAWDPPNGCIHVNFETEEGTILPVSENVGTTSFFENIQKCLDYKPGKENG